MKKRHSLGRKHGQHFKLFEQYSIVTRESKPCIFNFLTKLFDCAGISTIWRSICQILGPLGQLEILKMHVMKSRNSIG